MRDRSCRGRRSGSASSEPPAAEYDNDLPGDLRRDESDGPAMPDKLRGLVSGLGALVERYEQR